MVNDGIPQNFITNDNGIAWGLPAIFFLMVLGGALYLYFTPIINALVHPVNIYIGMDLVSQDTADAVGFGVNSWIFFPLVMIFGFFCFIVVRAHERRDY